MALGRPGHGRALDRLGQGATLDRLGQGATLDRLGDGKALDRLGQGATLGRPGHGRALARLGEKGKDPLAARLFRCPTLGGTPITLFTAFETYDPRARRARMVPSLDPLRGSELGASSPRIARYLRLTRKKWPPG